MTRKALLFCGILAALLYVATDILAAMRWEGYSYTAQTVSELFAIGDPTRPLVVLRGLAYCVLVIAFGSGVWGSAGGRRALRVAGGLLVGIGVVDLVGPFAPMHQREALAVGGGTLTDTMHMVLASVDVLFTRSGQSWSSSCVARWRVWTVLGSRQTCRRRGSGLRSASASLPSCSGLWCWPAVSYAPKGNGPKTASVGDVIRDEW